MRRSSSVLWALLCFAVVVGIGGVAQAALTVTIVQPATNPCEVDVNAAVTFEAVAFQDGEELENANVEWEWQFGDAVTSDQNPTSHAYVGAGDYTATVTARLGQVEASANTHVVVRAGPEIPNVVPFDPALSVYVGFSGYWINYATGQSTFREIEAPVALFGPGQQVADDPDTWGDHAVNSPQDPAGWTFYSPDDTQPMQMHVIVRDTQNRLGNVAITNRDTGSEIGTISANAAGSQIDGLVTAPSAVNYFLLNIRDKVAGATLAQAATDKPRAEDALVFSNTYCWDPNHGDEHTCPAIQELHEPWGNPDALQDAAGHAKEGSRGAGGGGQACAGVTAFTNNTPNVGQAAPHYDLLDKFLAKETASVPAGFALTAAQKVQAQIDAARNPYLGGITFLAHPQVPPFSRGSMHWAVHVNGTITAIVAVPYKWKAEWIAQASAEVGGTIPWNEGGGTDIASSVVLKWTISQQLKDKYRIGDGIPIGDVWARTADNPQTPLPQPMQGYTEHYTIVLVGDQTANGANSPIPGTGVVTTEGYWTAVSPPPGGAGTLNLTFPDAAEVDLQRGFKYKVTATPMCPGYSQATLGPFNVPNQSSPVTVVATLTCQLGLSFRTVQGGQPAQGHVEVKTGSGGSGTAFWQGTTVLNEQTGEYILYGPGAVQPGTYSARCTDNGGGEWVDFTAAVSPGPLVVTVTVPNPPGPPPGGGG